MKTRSVYPRRFMMVRRLVGLTFALVLASCSGGDDDDEMIDPRDGGTRDSGTEVVRDAGFRDGGVDVPDGGTPDSGTPRDGGARDGGPRDAGMCMDPLTNCDGVCADLFADDGHCGACNAACAGGDVCLSGVCGPPAPTLAATVPEQVVGPGCTIPSAQIDKVTVDPSGRIFVAMDCAGAPYVARSADLGVSYADPTPIAIPTVERFAIHAHAPDVLYAAANTTGGALVFAKSTDGGATWSAPRVVDAGPVASGLLDYGPHIASWRNHVFLAVKDSAGSEVRVWRNSDFGETTFELASITSATAAGGAIHVDPATGDLIAFIDAPLRFEIHRSTDLGQTFALEHMISGLSLGGDIAFSPPSTAYYSCASTFGNSTCTARIDVQAGTAEPLIVPAGHSAPHPFGFGVAASTDGSGYVVVRRLNMNGISDGALGVLDYAPTSTTTGGIQYVTTATTTDVQSGNGAHEIVDLNAVVAVFTSSVGASAAVVAY
jgi:hypothetical protein